MKKKKRKIKPETHFIAVNDDSDHHSGDEEKEKGSGGDEGESGSKSKSEGDTPAHPSTQSHGSPSPLHFIGH